MPQTLSHADMVRGVERQLFRYAAALDEGDLERWPTFFTDDAIYRLTPRENHDRDLPACLIHCRGTAMMRDRIAAIRKASVFSPHICRHLYANIRIEGDGAELATLYANYVAYRTGEDGDTELFSVGRLIATVEREPKHPIHEMTVIYDTLRIPGLLVYPL